MVDDEKSNNGKKRKSIEDSSSLNSKENDAGAKKLKPISKLQNFKFTKKN